MAAHICTSFPTIMIPAAMEDFLQPLRVNDEVILQLSREFAIVFQQLCAESKEMFLPTPISESLLRPVEGGGRGR